MPSCRYMTKCLLIRRSAFYLPEGENFDWRTAFTERRKNQFPTKQPFSVVVPSTLNAKQYQHEVNTVYSGGHSRRVNEEGKKSFIMHMYIYVYMHLREINKK